MPTAFAIANAIDRKKFTIDFDSGPDHFTWDRFYPSLEEAERDAPGLIAKEYPDSTKIKVQLSNEAEQDFVSKFMADPDERKKFPDEKQRAAVAYSMYREKKNAGPWPLSMKCSFIEPGIVRYADVGDVLVQKEVLDKMMNSFIGKPVVNEDHREVSPADFESGKAQGIINTVWFEPTDAMYHASYQVWDQPTLKNIKDGYKVSCAYKVTRWGPGGIHNNVPYEREVLDGEYTHLAIVPNPRYEGVRIYNTKGAKTMTLKWIKKLLGTDGKEMENSVDIESSKSIVDIDGKEVAMDDLVNAFTEQEEKKKKALENSAPADTDLIDVGGGRKVTLADLKNAYKAKNESTEEDRKKSDEEEKEREKKERDNSMAEDHKAGKHKDKELESCGMCNDLKNQKGRSHFERVDELANSRKGDFVDDLPMPMDGFALGRQRFGSEPSAKK